MTAAFIASIATVSETSSRVVELQGMVRSSGRHLASRTQPPSLAELLKELEALGKPATAKIYAKHGVKEPTVGLPYGQLDKLVKRLGVQHELVDGLWASGIHDGRMLAMKIADPERVTFKQLKGWLRNASNYVITDAIAGLASRSSQARELGLRFIASDDEWESAAGWNVLTDLTLAGKLDQPTAAPLLERIQQQLHAAKNRTRYSMNNTLIAIGASFESLRARAIEVAEALGDVQVDHGQTGCKTPSAADYIRKVVEHARRKADNKRSPPSRAKKKA